MYFSIECDDLYQKTEQKLLFFNLHSISIDTVILFCYDTPLATRPTTILYVIVTPHCVYLCLFPQLLQLIMSSEN